MFEGHFSFAICGLCDNRWVAYAFDDTESHHEDLSKRLFFGGVHWDPIASGRGNDIVPAEFPIWNPRDYFLNILVRRLCEAVDSWEALVRAIERRVMDYVSHQRCGLCFNWTWFLIILRETYILQLYPITMEETAEDDKKRQSRALTGPDRPLSS
jgi:hypothetical protein